MIPFILPDQKVGLILFGNKLESIEMCDRILQFDHSVQRHPSLSFVTLSENYIHVLLNVSVL